MKHADNILLAAIFAVCMVASFFAGKLCADDPWQRMPVEMRPVIKEVHPVQYTKDWSFGDPHQIGKPPQAWQQPEGVACLIVLDAERMRAIGNPVDIPRGFYTQLFVGNFPNFGDKLTMECETVEQ